MSNASPDPPAATPHEVDSSAALDRFGVPSRTREDLERFVALLREWQRTHNLVSSAALGEVWRRHVADSLQLLDHSPDFQHWVDLGSGAGFPGIVVAIACKDRPDRRFTLVEASGKKAAFLRAAIRATGARATVLADRIETIRVEAADIVSARALAPLTSLLGLAARHLREGGVILLLKGQDFVQEINAASKSWDFDVLDFKSVTDPGGRVLAIRHLRPKGHRS